MSTEINQMKIYNADAHDVVNKIMKKHGTVDHIITDPPYNISKDNNFKTMNRSGIDFGEWDRGEFDIVSWIPKYAEILSPNGSMVIFCSYKYLSYIISELETGRSGMVMKDVIIWQKTNPMPRNIHRRYVPDMEFAVWAVKKNAKWIFNKPSDLPYARSLFQAPVVGGKEKTGHPTQKSLKLMKDIILIHTNPGQTILDPFMGSGTTGEAAIDLGRKFIGIEIDEDYFEIARKRLTECTEVDYEQCSFDWSV